MIPRPSIWATVAVLCATAAAWSQTDGYDVRFQHPPMLYEGPDPTAGYFLPSSVPASAPPASMLALPPDAQYYPNSPSVSQYYPNSPPVSPEVIASPEGTGIYPDQPLMLDYPPAYESQHLTDHKEGFFQRLAFTGTYIDRGSINSFGINELDLCSTFAVPLPTREWPLLIIPAFNVRYLDGPMAPQLPPRLYETYVEFMWVPRFNECWTAIVSVAPSIYSDFEVDSEEGFRLTGKGLIRYDWSPNLQIIAGVLYLNRDDIQLLPAGGIIWTPDCDRKYELLFPRPKLAHRIDVGPGYEDWIYLGGEFGGNSFAFDRGGIVDKVTLRDYRALLGLERKFNGGAGVRIEVGYVFARTATFLSGIPDIEADSTALVRGGVTF